MFVFSSSRRFYEQGYSDGFEGRAQQEFYDERDSECIAYRDGYQAGVFEAVKSSKKDKKGDKG